MRTTNTTNQVGNSRMDFKQEVKHAWPNGLSGLGTTLLFLFLLFPCSKCLAQCTTHEVAGAQASVINGFVIAVGVTNGGAGYSVPPEVSFSGGGGSGAIAFAQITNGYVSSINVSNSGSGYATPPTVVIEPPLFDLNNTVVGYWPFEGNLSDASMYHQTGIAVGSVSYVAGAVGTAVKVSGGSDVDIGDPSDGRYDIGVGQSFSVSTWVNTASSGLNGWPMLLTKETGDASRQGWDLFFRAADNGIPGFEMYAGGIGSGVYSAVRVNDGQWHHLVVTKRGTSLAFYTDSVLQDTELCANVDYSTTVGLRLGKHSASWPLPYNGAADELRLYKRALEPREIKALYRRLPVITHPTSIEAPWGVPASFSTTVVASSTSFYQWFKDCQPIPLATGAVLTITNVQPTDAGLYRVTVRNGSGTVYSSNAMLTVKVSGNPIGSPGVPGSGSFSNGVFTVSGGGEDIEGSADSFHFVDQPWTGDCQVSAQLLSRSGGSTTKAEAGIMIREGFGPGAKHAFMAVNRNQAIFRRRPVPDQDSFQQVITYTNSPPSWLKLMRIGNTFAGLISTNGLDWDLVWWTTLNMTSQVQVGMAVTAHNNGLLSTATFTNVNICTLTPLTGARPPAPLFCLGGERLGPAEFQSLGGFKVLLEGNPGDWVRVRSTPDFATWADLGMVTNLYGLVDFLDPQALTNRFRFYRAQKIGP